MSTPGNKEYAIFGDWLAKFKSGNPNWESELTPEEIVAKTAERYDWPGPTRIGVMD